RHHRGDGRRGGGHLGGDREHRDRLRRRDPARARRQEPAQCALQAADHRPLSRGAAGDRRMNAGMQTWGLRGLALGIALGLWFNFSFEAREAPSERLVEAAVSYNRPRGFIVLDPVPSLNVRLRGSSKAVRRLSPFQVAVQVDLSRYTEGTWTVNLG